MWNNSLSEFLSTRWRGSGRIDKIYRQELKSAHLKSMAKSTAIGQQNDNAWAHNSIWPSIRSNAQQIQNWIASIEFSVCSTHTCNRLADSSFLILIAGISIAFNANRMLYTRLFFPFRPVPTDPLSYELNLFGNFSMRWLGTCQPLRSFC